MRFAPADHDRESQGPVWANNRLGSFQKILGKTQELVEVAVDEGDDNRNYSR